MTYDDLVSFSQTWGLIYLMIVFLGGVLYALWPSNRKHFNRAAHLPLDENEKPWQ